LADILNEPIPASSKVCPEVSGSRFLGNFGTYQNFTASHPKGW
jgi:hypothetical protein